MNPLLHHIFIGMEVQNNSCEQHTLKSLPLLGIRTSEILRITFFRETNNVHGFIIFVLFKRGGAVSEAVFGALALSGHQVQSMITGLQCEKDVLSDTKTNTSKVSTNNHLC